MKTLKYILILLSFITIPIVGSAMAKDNTSLALAQGTCPVMVSNPVDDSLYIDYQGERIFFCCKPCVEAFTESPEKYLGNVPQLETALTAHDQGGSHDHATDHAASVKSPRLVSFFGKFHPVAVHLPIALFLVAALAELLFLFTGVPLFRSAARFNLLAAVPAAAISILLGLAAAQGADYPHGYAQAFSLHRTLGFASLGLGLVATVSSERIARNQNTIYLNIYRISLLLSALAVGATGHFGGLLVYGLNHFSW